MKKIIFVLILIFWVKYSLAQNSSSNPIFVYQNKKLESFLYSYLHEKHFKSLDSLCIKYCTFIKFSISSKGSIENLEFSRGTPQKLENILTESLKASEKYWKPATISEKPTDSQSLILPFLYYLEGGCNDYVETITNNKIHHAFGKNDILSFDDKASNDYLNCILLSPLVVIISPGFQEIDGRLKKITQKEKD